MFPLDLEYVQCLLCSPIYIYVSFGLRVCSVLTVFTHIYVSFGLRVCSVLTVFTYIIYVSFGLRVCSVLTEFTRIYMFPLDLEYIQCLLCSPIDIYVSFGLRVCSVLTVFTPIYVSFGLRVCSVLTVFTRIYVSFGLQSIFSAYCVHLYVQCLLCSPVPPSLCPAEEEWSDEACLAFEELTHCAKWKVLSACTVGYDDDLPCIQLVDNAPDQVSL